ncbi:MAG: MarR family transcriptional regulator, partial [Eubacterium sp.]|nr:MarR family transcriptional regulator [Eubacterium sp.]
MKQDSLVSLLQASTLLSGVILSCADRKNYPFTKTQMNIFTILDMEGDLPMKRIARYLATSQEQTTRTVAPLADAGYVERRTDPSNRTRVYIHLTENGRRVIEDSRKALLENMDTRI